MSLANRSREVFKLARLYIQSAFEKPSLKAEFDKVETYCMFVGYPRSGHSIVGSLLDAHKHMIMPHELGVLQFVRARFSRNQIYHLLLNRSKQQTDSGARTKLYPYRVPGQWQGRYESLCVIGDKHGEGATLRLREKINLLQRLRRVVGIRIVVIHVTRNPYDNISTLFLRGDAQTTPGNSGVSPELRGSIDYYFSLCETVKKIKTVVPADDFIELRHETFIKRPAKMIENVCETLGLEAFDDYLEACAATVYTTPRKTRGMVDWSPELIDLVKHRMKGFPFLSGYHYQE